MGQKPLFITFEGGDGSGKSTQIRLLQEALAASGVSVITTREPGGTPQAERIRNLLLQRDSGRFDPMTEALLLFAARREHLVEKIWPAMKQGQWVLSDRFADSTRAFQGFGMGLDQTAIERMYNIVMGDFCPDLTFIFDIDPVVGLERSAKRSAATVNKTESTEDRYERMGLGFQQKLREGYLAIASKEPGRCVVIDAAASIEDIHRKVITVVEQRFGHIVKEAKYG